LTKNKILVIQKKRIGDVLTSTILLEALREKFPEYELQYLIYENSVAVVENNPFVDKIIIMNEKDRKSKLGFLKFLFQIRKENYEIIVDAYGKPNSVILGWFSGAKKTITFDKIYSKLLYTHPIKRNQTSFSNATKAIEHRMRLLSPLGIDFKVIKPKIFITENEISTAKSKLEKAGITLSKPLVMISAIGSNDSKTYPIAYMAKVIDTIADENDIQILFNYFPFQKEEARQLYLLCTPETQAKINFDFYEDNLRDFLAITSLCKALIGNEGGATNMAKALNIPTFTIFSPLVIKNDWNMFEDGKQNISVHVKDFESKLPSTAIDDLIKAKEYKKLQSVFTPELFEDQLINFISLNDIKGCK
jgi:heptosyltransferase II